MTLLKADFLVLCPKDNVKVEVAKGCVDCKSYSHMVFVGGAKAYVMCLFPNVKRE